MKRVILTRAEIEALLSTAQNVEIGAMADELPAAEARLFLAAYDSAIQKPACDA